MSGNACTSLIFRELFTVKLWVFGMEPKIKHLIKVQRSWKGYPFETLDELKRKNILMEINVQNQYI